MPLVPRVLRGLDLDEPGDPLAFTEWCALRAVGAVVVGGVLGFGMGALFSGYGSLAPYDPAQRDWQLAQEAQARAAAEAAAKRTAAPGAGAAAAPAATGASAAVAAAAPATAGAGAAMPASPRFSLPAALAQYTPSLPGTLASPARLPVSAVSAASSAFAAASTPRAPLAAAAVTPAASAAPLPAASSSLGALPFPTEPPKQSLRAVFVSGLREMRSKGWSSAKSFGVVGGVFTLIECSLERLRGVKDMKNAVASGFATGAILAASAGPAAMVIGGAGFAAFSAVIELAGPYIFEGH